MKGLLTNLYLFLVILLISAVSCKNAKSGNGTDENPLTFKTITAADTLLIKLHYLGEQNVFVKYTVDFPESYLDGENTVALKNLFYTEVLGCDSVILSPDKALQKAVENYSGRFSSVDYVDSLSLHEASEMPDNVLSEIQVKTVFNSDTIFSVCKSRTTTNNAEKPMKEHVYYNIDLRNMRLLELTDLFAEESLDPLNQMLKNKLLEQNNVKTEDDLIQLGYFNLDNLFAGNNFYINEKGITWNFLPLEISCFNIGETEIFLSYAELTPLMEDTPSIISKYMIN